MQLPAVLWDLCPSAEKGSQARVQSCGSQERGELPEGVQVEGWKAWSCRYMFLGQGGFEGFDQPPSLACSTDIPCLSSLAARIGLHNSKIALKSISEGLNQGDTTPDPARTISEDLNQGDTTPDPARTISEGLNQGDTTPDPARTISEGLNQGDTTPDPARTISEGLNQGDTTPDPARTSALPHGYEAHTPSEVEPPCLEGWLQACRCLITKCWISKTVYIV